MDPLTHTLVGASLATTRLGRATRLAAPALVVGANLPDVDALSYVAGSDAALAFRRGWTHGLPALALLPAALALVLWLLGRRRPPGRDEPPLAGGRLLALSYLACLTHPALDWLNTYGMRWLMPFDGRWSYGDAVFIMDPWLWLLLGGAWLLGRRPGPGLVATFIVVGGLLLLIVAGRAPSYLPLVAAVALALLAALLWKLPPAFPRSRLALAALALAIAYVGSLLLLQGATERRVRAELAHLDVGPLDALMVGPVPADPRRWDVVVETAGAYRYGRYHWRADPALQLAERRLPPARGGPEWRHIETRGAIPGFRLWARFPWLETEPAGDGLQLHLMDARYVRRLATGFGAATVTLPAEDPP